MKLGAADFLTKPVDTDHLLLLLDRAIERRRVATELVLLKEEYQRRFGLPRVLGDDPSLKEAMLALQRAAGTDATVLLLGESGTGKELMSRALHQLSAAGQGPVRGHQLRGDPGEPARERAVRPREGRLHRGHGAQDRQGGARAPRHALPRRDRRHAAAAAGQDPAARPGAAVRAGRRAADAERRRARGGGHQPRPARAGGGEAVPRGPVLPPVRDADRDPAAAPPPPRHPAAGRGVPAALRARDGPQGPAPLGRRQACARRALLAGQRARARRTASSAPRSCAAARRSSPSTCGSTPGPAAGRRSPTSSTCRDRSPRSRSGPRRAPRRTAIALAMREAEGDRAAAAARLGISVSTLGRRLREAEDS